MVPSRKGMLASAQWPTQTRGRVVPTDFWFFSVPITFSPSPGVLLLTFATSLMLEWPGAIRILCLEREKVKVFVTQSCPTLFATSMDSSPPGSSVHGILQARILEWVAISFSRGSSLPGSNSGFLHCRQILYHLSQSFLNPTLTDYSPLYPDFYFLSVFPIWLESDLAGSWVSLSLCLSLSLVI